MPTREEVAQRLADAHYQVETGISQIFRITGPSEVQPNEPIKLLEVNEHTVPSGILPLHFGPLPGSGITFPSTIIEVTPDEFQRIQTREIRLPDGWSLGPLLPRANGRNGK